MFLAAQYYRAPFPNRRFWADDFSRMRDCGLHAVQLWCIWGWIEPEPGVYRYEDYDELIDLAQKRGLKVVLSTIAEIQPFWIHRLVPGSEMVDHTGNRVISSCRTECNVGLTPGGCTDNPEVARRMGAFLANIGARYAGLKHLVGWDSWNETRWNVNADNHVCHCEHTLREFRRWLDERHGGMEGLNKAWQRRYSHWDDVLPGKLPQRTYTEMMEFLRFLTVRAARHARFRYEAIRRGDPKHFISAHCGTPASRSDGWLYEQTLCRGVDWDLADQLDGFGCSHFPFWGGGVDDDGFGVRVENSRSASQGKPFWVSELQGGSARGGIMADRSVQAKPQQRWVANAMARGAKGVIFWCWRDEVFGRESSGFGLDGWDGLARERLEAMKRTSRLIGTNRRLIDSYRPDPPRVGVLFVPDVYFMEWADDGSASEPADSVIGYCTAMERLRVPYEVVEARHLDALDGLDVLLMPWALILPPDTRRAILKFIRRGGRILCEAETDAFDELGFYRYPNERPFMQAIGVQDLGRRKLGDEKTVAADLLASSAAGGADPSQPQSQLVLDNFITPLTGGAVLASDGQGQALLVGRRVSKGKAFVVGSFLGKSYFHTRNEGLEQLIRHVCADAGVTADIDVDAGDGNRLLQWRTGRSGARRLLWVLNGGGDREVRVAGKAATFGRSARVEDLRSARSLRLAAGKGDRQFRLKIPAGEFAVLSWSGAGRR